MTQDQKSAANFWGAFYYTEAVDILKGVLGDKFPTASEYGHCKVEPVNDPSALVADLPCEVRIHWDSDVQATVFDIAQGDLVVRFKAVDRELIDRKAVDIRIPIPYAEPFKYLSEKCEDMRATDKNGPDIFEFDFRGAFPVFRVNHDDVISPWVDTNGDLIAEPIRFKLLPAAKIDPIFANRKILCRFEGQGSDYVLHFQQKTNKGTVRSLKLPIEIIGKNRDLNGYVFELSRCFEIPLHLDRYMEDRDHIVTVAEMRDGFAVWSSYAYVTASDLKIQSSTDHWEVTPVKSASGDTSYEFMLPVTPEKMEKMAAELGTISLMREMSVVIDDAGDLKLQSDVDFDHWLLSHFAKRIRTSIQREFYPVSHRSRLKGCDVEFS